MCVYVCVTASSRSDGEMGEYMTNRPVTVAQEPVYGGEPTETVMAGGRPPAVERTQQSAASQAKASLVWDTHVRIQLRLCRIIVLVGCGLLPSVIVGYILSIELISSRVLFGNSD